MLYRLKYRAGRHWQSVGIDCHTRAEALAQSYMLPRGVPYIVVTVGW